MTTKEKILRVELCTLPPMSQQHKAGNDQLLVMLKATLDGIDETKRKHEGELLTARKEQDAAKAEIRQLGGSAPVPTKTLFGFKNPFGQISIGKIADLQADVSQRTSRIEMLRHLIQDCDNAKEKAIDDHLLATDEHYRVDSMRWSSVVRFKHSLELYIKAVDKAVGHVEGVRQGEKGRAESGLHTRSSQELLEHSEYIKAIDLIKEGVDGFGKEVEDMVQHFGDKVSCSITITYHGTMTFDIYKYPEHLSLYVIESLEGALDKWKV